ncbi:MAG: iron ABC transporter permease [Lachnospiraceae bacterium]|nr:iron ABC transporter permease [Lachnospiraceae bacterium]
MQAHLPTYTNYNRIRCVVVLGSLVVCMVALSVANLVIGSVAVDFHSEAGWRILFDIRLPRLMAALILGGALAVAGFLLQTFFNNPLAGPFVLGISSGAKLIVALVMIVALENGIVLNSWGMIGAAFLGAMLSMGFVLLISSRTKTMGILIICGIMVGYFCSATTELFITFAKDTNIVNLHNWAQGSFAGISWNNVVVMAIVVALSMVATIFLAKPMGAYQLGVSYAMNLGVNVRRFRVYLILVSSLLAACVTAFAGPIAFVGIAVPQLLKRVLKSQTPGIMIPASFLGGSVFCLLSDLMARVLFAPTELSISVVTSVLGAPIVIWIMLRRAGQRDE